MKLIYLVIGLFFFTSCGNKQTTKIEKILTDSLSIKKVPKEMIHPELRKAIMKFSNSAFLDEFPNIPIKESCFIMESWVSKKDSAINLSDSTIILSYNILIDTPEGYKGYINIDGYNVAIMDHFNFLDGYYNTDSLYIKDFNFFKRYPANYNVEELFYIQNGVLKK